MIGRVRGVIWEKAGDSVLIDVGGLGLTVHTCRRTLGRLPPEGAEAEMHIHTHMREDAIRLYGFLGRMELELFQTLIGVSNVGPKVALAILGVLGPRDFRRAVAFEDVALLTEVPGIGKKTAERLLVEMKDKLGPLPRHLGEGASAPPTAELASEAVEALVGLGYGRREAIASVERALPAGDPEAKGSVGDVVKAALRLMGGQ